MYQLISKKMSKKRKGFTLIELVVVIAILGILAAIAIPRLAGSRETAAITAHNANVRTLESAATIAVTEGVTDVTWDGDNTNNELRYLQSWPEIPTGLVGKTFEGITTPADPDAEPPVLEVRGPISINEDDAYIVEIDVNGFVTVTPGLITD